MKKSLRLLTIACAGLAALTFAAPALAAYNPSLTIEQSSYKLGAAITSDTFIFASQNDDPTAKLTIAAPGGYGVNLSQAAGTKIGRVVAIVKANALAGALLGLTGDVVVANGTDPTIVAASQRCTGRPANQATWILNATLQGQSVQIPVFVNKPATGPSATLEVCLPPPQTATFGAQLVSADFTTTGVFTNPSARNGYEWSGVFTPYTTGTTVPNVGATLEWRTYVGLPSSLTLRRVKSKSAVKLAGALHVTGVTSKGIRLRLYYAAKSNPAPNAVHGPASKAKVARTARLPASGNYTVKRRGVRTRTYFQMRFEGYVLTPCSPPSPAPQGCKGEDIAALTSSQVRVSPARRRRG
jgi:hypothetical protein